MSDKETKINETKIDYVADGVDKWLYVVKPTSKQHSEASILASKTFAKLVGSKDKDGNPTCILRQQVNEYMKANGLWSDEEDEELKKLIENIRGNLRKLAKGNIKLNEAKAIAIDIRRDRIEQTLLLAKQTELDGYTVEGQIENVRFDYLVSVCILDENRKPLFDTIEDYGKNGDQDHVIEAATELSGMLYGLDPDWQNKLPENKFLLKYKFANDDLHLVNKDNKLVDVDGNLVDKDGRLINDEGKWVNLEGELVDEDGMTIEEFSPFLDDDGNPVE